MAHHADGLFFFGKIEFRLSFERSELCSLTGDLLGLLDLCFGEIFKGPIDSLILNDLVKSRGLNFISKRTSVEDRLYELWQDLRLLGAADLWDI